MQRLFGSYTGATDMMTKEQGETLNIGHFCLAIDPNAFGKKVNSRRIWMR